MAQQDGFAGWSAAVDRGGGGVGRDLGGFVGGGEDAEGEFGAF
jgi:hypothetical protein